MQSTGNDIKITVDGNTICYDDFGSGTTPIIFIHGFPFNKSTWQPQMEALKENHRVIAYDIRGFGNSSATDENFSINLFADDLIKFMDALQIQKSIVCGLSMGGYIALNAVNRYAKRFEALILCDTQCIADSEMVKDNRYKTIKEIEENGLNQFATNFIETAFCEETLKTKVNAVNTIKNIILSTSQKTITKTLTALANRQELCFSLPQIFIPALILCGREDKITPLKQSEYLNDHFVYSTLHSLDKAGHLSNLEQPAAFNKYVNEFISILNPATVAQI
ncbi:MAG: alpha/beta hydrolase [Bacteroidota bacterium]